MVTVLNWLLPAALAFAGSVIGILITRRNATDLDRRWRREETLRTLRWATDLAADSDPVRSEIGVGALIALADAELVQAEDLPYIKALLGILARRMSEAYPGKSERKEAE